MAKLNLMGFEDQFAIKCLLLTELVTSYSVLILGKFILSVVVIVVNISEQYQQKQTNQPNLNCEAFN